MRTRDLPVFLQRQEFPRRSRETIEVQPNRRRSELCLTDILERDAGYALTILAPFVEHVRHFANRALRFGKTYEIRPHREEPLEQPSCVHATENDEALRAHSLDELDQFDHTRSLRSENRRDPDDVVPLDFARKGLRAIPFRKKPLNNLTWRRNVSPRE